MCGLTNEKKSLNIDKWHHMTMKYISWDPKSVNRKNSGGIGTGSTLHKHLMHDNLCRISLTHCLERIFMAFFCWLNPNKTCSKL